MVGPFELAMVLIALIIVFGVGKLGDIGGALGRGIREFKQEVSSLKEPEQLEDNEKDKV